MRTRPRTGGAGGVGGLVARAALLVACGCAGLLGEQGGDRGPTPFEPGVGGVTLSRRSRASNAPPVTFQHWRHRSRFTCRVCHVDVGFAMAAGATGVSAATNGSGHHCGACHDGRTGRGGNTLFAACSDRPIAAGEKTCERCHAPYHRAREADDYGTFVRRMPRSADGEVDWQRAEELGLIHPADFVAGASFPAAPLSMKKDVALELDQAHGIVFSHAKHAVWNGCELCHPEIFPTASRRLSRGARMNQLIGGQYCGACHGKVAFGFLGQCERCHTSPRVPGTK